jgi:isoquinoline 1-oxidoreductase alpha subunit
MAFVLNGEIQHIPDEWADESLLNLLRDHFGLVGAKLGCGLGLCGACTVIVDGIATRSCITRAENIDGAELRSIEGLATGGTLHPVQQAWLDLAVPQCGYCQAGQIMSAVALLDETPSPSESDIDTAMDGNLCRCGTYGRIRAAIRRAAEAA